MFFQVFREERKDVRIFWEGLGRESDDIVGLTAGLGVSAPHRPSTGVDVTTISGIRRAGEISVVGTAAYLIPFIDCCSIYVMTVCSC